MPQKEYYSNTQVVINAPTNVVWNFVTAPRNWMKVSTGGNSYEVFGPGGREDIQTVSRTMRVGEIFHEQADRPGQFDLEGRWVITQCDEKSDPRKYGFKTLSFDTEFAAEINAVYTFMSIANGTRTRWCRDRVSKIPAEREQKVEFLVQENDLEEEYQQKVKRYLEAEAESK
jgi:hypothetical protein